MLVLVNARIALVERAKSCIKDLAKLIPLPFHYPINGFLFHTRIQCFKFKGECVAQNKGGIKLHLRYHYKI